MKPCILGLSLLALANCALAAAGDLQKGQQIASQVCAACHGPDGNSFLGINPHLAGQHADYLVKQIKNYKSGDRKTTVMAGMVSPLSDEDIKNVAAYFSTQTPKGAGTKDANGVEMGRKLYRGGNPGTGVAACAGCHSPNGAGIPAQYPRLAGQHAEYVTAQLKAFRGNERANDPNNMMRAIAARMTDKEIEAVAQYISALK
ncbi:MAG: cytochrome c4 [Betaproteobacteria bacterium]|nr:cytochrome c4 [Betaproteobacteria bacterium]